MLAPPDLRLHINHDEDERQTAGVGGSRIGGPRRNERAPFFRVRQRRAFEQDHLRRAASVERNFHGHIARAHPPEPYERWLLALKLIGADQLLIVETDRLNA